MARRSTRPRRSNSSFLILIILVLAGILIYQNRHELGIADWLEDAWTELGLPPQQNPGRSKSNPPTTEPPASEEPTSTKQNTSGYAFEKLPDFGLPISNSDCQTIRHQAYTLCYVEAYEQPSFVAYRLTAEETTGQNERTNNFRPDAAVTTGSALPDDYRGSGYDKGHLAPSGDFKSSSRLISESFYMSNMSPQKPDFNRGCWKILEEKVRTWVRKDGVLYVVTGPVLRPGLKTIGKRNQVAIPVQYYKVILDLQQQKPRMIAFLMRNEGSSAPTSSFALPADRIEALTGLDFFPQLPDDLEKQLEGTVELESWF